METIVISYKNHDYRFIEKMMRWFKKNEYEGDASSTNVATGTTQLVLKKKPITSP